MAQIILLQENCRSYSDQARKMVRVYCALKDIQLSRTEEQVMAYLITYGINDRTKQDFLIGKLLKTPDSLSSMLNKLKRLKLLEKDEMGYHLPPKLRFQPQRMIGVKIKLENV
jgi:hypothetical protein